MALTFGMGGNCKAAALPTPSRAVPSFRPIVAGEWRRPNASRRPTRGDASRRTWLGIHDHLFLASVTTASQEARELARLLEARVPTPPDFGGRVASMLWDVEVQYFSKVEYIHLFFGLGNVPVKMRTRRVVSPELYSLLRCSRLVRQALIAAVETRRLTMEPEESSDERSRVDELCSALRYKYPASWARAWGQGRWPEETEPAPVVVC
eukprot:symbB.v1.2.009042.t1/scaffold569.1/size186053/11